MAHLPSALLYLQQQYPHEHPFTLALRLQALTGHEFSGDGMKRALQQLQPPAEASLRCCAADLAQPLRLIAAGVADFRLAAPVQFSGVILLKMDEWIIELVASGDALAFTARANAADGRSWVYGCERDDWSLGPGSTIVDPLQLLSTRERMELMQVLREQPAPVPTAVAPMTASRPAVQAPGTPSKRRKRAAA